MTDTDKKKTTHPNAKRRTTRKSRALEEDRPSEEAIREFWGACDHWPLPDAVRLALGHLPRRWQQGRLPKEAEQRIEQLTEFAMNCAGASLPVRPPLFPGDDCRVAPLEFLEWIERRTELKAPDLETLVIVAQHEKHKREAGKKMRLSTQRRIRCRAIAELLWQHDPNMTIAKMIGLREIREIGCEGVDYAPDTIRDWIKDLCGNRAPGRRPSPKTPG